MVHRSRPLQWKSCLKSRSAFGSRMGQEYRPPKSRYKYKYRWFNSFKYSCSFCCYIFDPCLTHPNMPAAQVMSEYESGSSPSKFDISMNRAAHRNGLSSMVGKATLVDATCARKNAWYQPLDWSCGPLLLDKHPHISQNGSFPQSSCSKELLAVLPVVENP